MVDLFDLHCDTVTECCARGLELVNDETAVALDRRKDGRWAQVFAIFMPDTLRGDAAERYFDQNWRYFVEQLYRHRSLTEQYRRAGDVKRIQAAGKCCAILAVEGGSALAGKLERIPLLASYGVKLLTLTWNGENEIAGGAATNTGLTAFGEQAIAELEKNDVIIDCSHLNDRSFYAIMEKTTKPVVASHSNSRAVCPNRRNLTDEQFRFICARGGLVGLNLFCEFLNPQPDKADIEDVLRHLEHFLALGGEDCVCLGTDFDGAQLPESFDRVEKLDFLAEALLKTGLSDKMLQKLFYENACRFFEQV